MKKMNRQLIALEIASFIFLVAPLAFVLISKWNDWVKVPSDGVKLCAGAVIVLFLIVIQSLGKLKIPSSIIFYAIVFILSYFLQPILSDMTLISGVALIGECLSYFLFEFNIKKLRKTIENEKTATLSAEKIKDVLREYTGGRV